jgi:hypothetical protein
LFDQYLHLKTAHQFIVSEADFTKINNSQLPMAPAKVREMMGFKSFMNAFENSRFGQTNLTTSQKSILLDFLWSIDNKKCIKITSFIPLTTHQHQLIPGVNELLNPVKIIYHRGDFIITIIENETKMVYSFELDKIEKIKLTDISFEYSSTKEERDIKNNFGYHSTINSRIYKIKLLFPPTPGGYVMNRKWHGSQQFHIRKNGFIEMKFSSRICIELLGWIMMWMDNVEVLGPQKLNDISSVKLKNMSKLNNHKILPINNSDNQVASK